MPDFIRKPEIIVFAGPNGSGKTTITKLAKTIEPYINADDIKKVTLCGDMDAAIKADQLRNQLIEQNESFTFETVLSTERNLLLLKKAKDKGYFIRCIYVLTSNPKINVLRVKSRFALGGHDVPEDKILSRYSKALKLIPSLLDICDVCHIYDNTDDAYRIFKKRKDEFFYWESEFWNKAQIQELVGIEL
jgi:Uncharacterized protein conserved in bacteria